MANIALIHINAASRSASDLKSGYGDEFLIAEMVDFTAIQAPVNSATPGSSKKITTAHTFTNPKGFTELRGKMGSGSGDGESIGESGGGVMQYKPKIIVSGDSPEQCEYIEALLNKEVMLLAPAPDCDSTAPYVQFGGKCGPAQVSKVTFKSGELNAGGIKQYEIEFVTFYKYFYSATVTKKAA